MKNALSFAGLALFSVLAAGCSSMPDIWGDETPSPQVQTRQDLSMPPDLQLRPPEVAQNYAAPATVAEPVTETASASTAYSAPQPAPGAGDVYERNGISKVNADGSKKTQAQLDAELKKIYLSKKQAANPKYGTVFNIGNIFKDE